MEGWGPISGSEAGAGPCRFIVRPWQGRPREGLSAAGGITFSQDLRAGVRGVRKASQLARPRVTVRNPGVKSPKDCCQDSPGQ